MVYLNNWLEQQGHLQFTAQRDSWLKKIALAVVPDAWRGTIFRKFKGLASKAESQSRFSGIDFGTTCAWSEELNYFPSIRVNLQGREPEGQVPAEDYEQFCRDLCAELETWDVIEKAWRRDDIYTGDYVHRAPDIALVV